MALLLSKPCICILSPTLKTWGFLKISKLPYAGTSNKLANKLTLDSNVNLPVKYAVLSVIFVICKECATKLLPSTAENIFIFENTLCAFKFAAALVVELNNPEPVTFEYILRRVR